MRDFFKFEDENMDIPFYNGIPKLSKLDWLILIIAEILFITPIILPNSMDDVTFSFYLCLVVLIPVLYVSKGKLNLFFKKIRKSDVKLIIICVIAPYIYSMFMLFIIETFKLAPPTNVEGSSLSILIIVCTLVQLIGEELFKIILFILTMSLIYHFSKNRKLSIGISMIITMIVFGFAHAGAYGTFAQVLLIQGLGSIFDLYAYIKTKNVWVSYIAHVIFDFIPFALEILLIFM